MGIWIARDKSGQLYRYCRRPLKDEDSGCWSCGLGWIKVDEKEYPEGYFSNVKWEDEKPTRCVLGFYPKDKRLYICFENQ